ncbi:class IV adenylate cyclase [Patescibacteria group bacterium]|nr:class IV adenylate cyclase [Patescibacteria group bacterium]
MTECEVKILGIDKDQLIAKLEAAGAKLLFSGELDVYYYDTADGDIRAKNELLRLRKIGDQKVELVYKKNRREENGCKVLDEHEIEVSDFDEARIILESLGYGVRKNYVKTRTEYEFEDLKFVIDEFEGVPAYLEIEGETGQIDEWVKKLDLGDYERSAETLDELMKRYKK